MVVAVKKPKAAPAKREVATLDTEFEKEVVARALHDVAYLREAVTILESHHLADKHLAWCWGVVKETWLKISETPKLSHLTARAKRDFAKESERLPVLKMVASLWKHPATSARSSLEEVRRFAKMAHLHDMLLSSAERLKDSDPDEAEAEIRKGLRTVPRARDYEVVRWMEEWETRQANRRYLAEHPDAAPVIPTGISKKLDMIVKLRKGMLASVTATTSKGKSICLNNVGWHAASHGWRVVHVTTEMNAEEQADRYDSRFTLIPYDKFKDFSFSPEELRHIGRRVEKFRERLLNRLRICAVPVRRCDMALVRQLVADMAGEMGGVDVVITDSLDHMISTVRHREIRLDQAEVYWEGKTFAQEGWDGTGLEDADKRVLHWTSTQAGKEWADIIATAESGSESYDKGRILDLMLSLNTPKKERSRKRGGVIDEDDEPRGDDEAPRYPKLEGYIAKWRHGRSRVRVPFEADFARMWIKEGVDEEVRLEGDE